MNIPYSWLEALENRSKLPEFHSPAGTIRLLHTEDPYVRCDRYGSVCWYYWYHLEEPTAAALMEIEAFTRKAGATHWVVRYMQNRGTDPHHQHLWQSEPFTEWQAEELSISYILRTTQGLSPGLFLDQKLNRDWLQTAARDKTVLNLFAYTGGFGLAAAKGQAASVLNVDTSKNTLAWAKENATVNNLQMDYYAMDAREFLKRCRKQDRKFDLIICDPPSFARSKKGIWKIEKDLPDLIRLILPVLTPAGVAFLSTNFEGWSEPRFLKTVTNTVPTGFSVTPCANQSPDFTCASNSTLLKACRINRQELI